MSESFFFERSQWKMKHFLWECFEKLWTACPRVCREAFFEDKPWTPERMFDDSFNSFSIDSGVQNRFFEFSLHWSASEIFAISRTESSLSELSETLCAISPSSRDKRLGAFYITTKSLQSVLKSLRVNVICVVHTKLHLLWVQEMLFSLLSLLKKVADTLQNSFLLQSFLKAFSKEMLHSVLNLLDKACRHIIEHSFWSSGFLSSEPPFLTEPAEKHFPTHSRTLFLQFRVSESILKENTSFFTLQKKALRHHCRNLFRVLHSSLNRLPRHCRRVCLLQILKLFSKMLHSLLNLLEKACRQHLPIFWCHHSHFASSNCASLLIVLHFCFARVPILCTFWNWVLFCSAFWFCACKDHETEQKSHSPWTLKHLVNELFSVAHSWTKQFIKLSKNIRQPLARSSVQCHRKWCKAELPVNCREFSRRPFPGHFCAKCPGKGHQKKCLQLVGLSTLQVYRQHHRCLAGT